MKTNSKKLSSAITIPAGILTGLLLGYYFFSQQEPRPEPTAVDSKSVGEVWTCSMHPQVKLPEPGACPICGMNLIPLKTQEAHDHEATLTLSDNARTLAAIRTTAVVKGSAEKEIRLFGKVSYDETRLKTISARFPARIEKLYVNATGIPVKEGDHLASVYSKDLLAAQTDLITSLKFSSRENVTIGPREQLRQWGFSEKHIKGIEESLVAQEFLEIDAPIGGTVVAKSIQEGDHVALGENFFTIADLTHVWITFDAYESELPWIHYGQEISIFAEANPGQKFTGKVSLIYPEIDPMSRTAKIRVSIPNPDQILKPGQFVRGILKAKLNSSGQVVVPDLSGKWVCPMHPEIVKNHPANCDVCGMELASAIKMGLGPRAGGGEPLLVPSSAVLQTGKRAVVYVETSGENGSTYEGREVELGVRAGDQFVILSGLKEGDQVVSEGAFKIDSALQIQAKPSMMGIETRAKQTGHQSPDASPLDSKMAAKLLPTYLKLQAALAGDNLADAKAEVSAMMESIELTGPNRETLQAMAAAESLDGMRRPHFDALSEAMIQAIRSNPQVVNKDLYLMHCPMVYDDHGADWLQENKELKNPYFGSTMLHCGEVTETLVSHKEHGH